MRNTRLTRSALAVVVAASLASFATGCANSAAGLDGNIGAGGSATLAVSPGRPADFTGFLVNHTGSVVILKSARLLPLKGFRAPQLIHEAIEPRKIFATSDSDWPPTEPKLPLKDFAEYRIPPGRRINILYSVVARKVGEYADTGIEVTMLVDGRSATVDVISFAGTCILQVLGNRSCPESFINRLQKAAGQSP
jgi:hypothetical protein